MHQGVEKGWIGNEWVNVNELLEGNPLFMKFDCYLISRIASLTFTPKIDT